MISKEDFSKLSDNERNKLIKDALEERLKLNEELISLLNEICEKYSTQTEYEPLELDECAGDQVEQYVHAHFLPITKDMFENGYGVYSINLETFNEHVN